MVLDRVDSTNAEAARRAAGGTSPLWIMAQEQTGGRGRRGRPWSSPRGNFHATLLLHPAGTPDLVALRSFVAALALRDACVALTGLPQAFTLKWPNDLLLNGGKLAGILLEGAGQGSGLSHLAIGFGVNLIAAPDPELVEPGALRPASLLAETGIRVVPDRFLAALAPAYARRESTFCAQGFAPLRQDWLAHAARLGQPVVARTGASVREGIFETIDATGALVLRTPAARLAIPAADVFF
ncbi:MAG: biotin--[acetyl-CoA-carboxylase] ligase [Rhodobacter sp.]|nr:biotin--[acetyl-CoA-carboxylase] ligase [Rhodobacter sp.]MCA3513534.1 biotin--[acetyl-CoA-carboxylase] ligase [Rhodobacter sp.]MCA3520050.1 biotin--[acetyl-CoA-carboxylase] ligase [Rhodobacter sp.]MCA3522991.1 biotin--[acetyl-CoA-carboxylase] ligase [Rhodobacter sp.]MCA3527167.1 biotin--[acetyl-CoA-carboxylase] ligase [Rhodobacter sp.]